MGNGHYRTCVRLDPAEREMLRQLQLATRHPGGNLPSPSEVIRYSIRVFWNNVKKRSGS
jgi:hypothetical protein